MHTFIQQGFPVPRVKSSFFSGKTQMKETGLTPLPTVMSQAPNFY